MVAALHKRVSMEAPVRAQAYGQKAKESLSDLVLGKSVEVAWSKPEDREAYAQSESQARDKRMGLWRDPAPMEPSVFRQKK